MTTTDSECLVRYKNGNCQVTLYQDGTKVRELPTELPATVDFPESIDVKITDYCDLGCPYCHESSTTKGRHSDLNSLLAVISPLPRGVELAIGGGNPLSHPNLFPFLEELQSRGIICNLTVNQRHLHPYRHLIRELVSKDLIRGLGVSLTSSDFGILEEISKESQNLVYHVIAGVNPVSTLDKLLSLDKGSKVLILGYKTFGRGVHHHNERIEEGIREWYRALPSYLGRIHLSFDNLAIEQLNVKRLFTEDGWKRFFMGEDGQFSMYIDAVEKKYARTSRSSARTSFSTVNLKTYFNSLSKHP